MFWTLLRGNTKKLLIKFYALYAALVVDQNLNGAQLSSPSSSEMFFISNCNRFSQLIGMIYGSMPVNDKLCLMGRRVLGISLSVPKLSILTEEEIYQLIINCPAKATVSNPFVD